MNEEKEPYFAALSPRFILSAPFSLRAELRQPYTSLQLEKITSWVGVSEQRFVEVLDSFLQEGKATAKLSAGTVYQISQRHPDLVRPHLPALVANLQNPVSGAMKRYTLRVLQHFDIPEESKGLLAESCFTYLQDAREAVAVRAFAITVLANICAEEPELKREFLLVLEEQLPFAGAGFRVRARKAMEVLHMGKPQALTFE